MRPACPGFPYIGKTRRIAAVEAGLRSMKCFETAGEVMDIAKAALLRKLGNQADDGQWAPMKKPNRRAPGREEWVLPATLRAA